MPKRPPVTLRGETADDRDWLLTLYAKTRADELAAVPLPQEAKARFVALQFALQQAHIDANHPAALREIIVSDRDGVRVGRLCTDRTRQPWRLIDIALEPAWRSGGIGGVLLRRLQRAAAAAGTGIELHVALGNYRAEALYARLGFRAALSVSATHRRMVWTP